MTFGAEPADGRAGPSAEDALPALMGMLGGLGITRLADVTGLDRLGLRVIQAVRPGSLSNAVAQGKGLTPAGAAVSAILESAEAALAERLDAYDVRIGTAETLAVPEGWYEPHLAEDAPADWRRRPTAWVEAANLLAPGAQPVPLELVHTAYTHPPAPHDGLFAGSTSGLAAGLAEADAVLHGLLECIERDAIARAMATHGFLQRARLDPATAEDAVLVELLDRLAGAGMLVGLWLAPGCAGVAVVWCHIMEAEEAGALLPFPADGSAASLSLAAAATRAVLEAAQARLAAISGARDDITRAAYPRHPDRAHLAAHRRLLAEGPLPLPFDDADDDGTRPWLETLLDRLAAGGHGHVLRVRLDTAAFAGLHAVKVIVPGLLPPPAG
jgi:ribosomal protein S12 methylthiotransferase accessory factor